MKDFLDIFHEHKMKNKFVLDIPQKLQHYFHIQKFDIDNDIMINYIIHHPLLVKASIQ